MPLTKEKLKSFVELCKTEKVAKVLLVEEFPNYCESEFQDALKYFESKGMIQTDPIDDITVCGWIAQEMIIQGQGDFKRIIGDVMKRSGGRLNPNRVHDLAYKMLFGDKR